MIIEIKNGAIKEIAYNGVISITNPGDVFYFQTLKQAVQVYIDGNWYNINDFNREVIRRIYGS